MNILIIDDNRVNLMYAESVIGQIPGTVPTCFEDPIAALAWAGIHRPDMVVVDFMMPEMDGMEVIRQFRAMAGCLDVPLVMVTAVDARAVRHQALDLGATDFLTKPLDPIELRARVVNLLALRRASKTLASRADWLAEEVALATAQIAQREFEVILRLCRAAEYRDGDTGAHVVRVAHFSRMIARNLGMTRREQDVLFQAAPMHDIGKVGIPDAILLKPGRLNPEEWAVMQTHTAIGKTILEHSRAELITAAAEVAISHHERWDGKGYPHGLAGTAIPIFGRIVAIADVFDALTSRRPYKQPWPREQAIAYIQAESGKHLDPTCVAAFLADPAEINNIQQRFETADPLFDLALDTMAAE